MSNFNKMEQELDKLIAVVENITTESSPIYTEQVYSLIKWQTLGELLGRISRLDDYSSSPQSLQKKLEKNRDIFKAKIKEILGYRRKLKDVGVSGCLNYFKSATIKSFKLAEDHIKILPQKSFEIYEDALKFIDFFQISGLNQGLLNTAKTIIKKKILIIKKAFEVEAGRKNLEEEQKQLSTSLTNNLEGKSEESKNKESLAQDIDFNEINNVETDLSISGLTLPEEGVEEIPYTPVQIQTPVIEKVEEIKELELIDVGSKPISIISLDSLFPKQNYDSFNKLRYCYSCGKKIDQHLNCPNCKVDNRLMVN